MSREIESSLIRILDADNQPVGAGFLVAGQKVLTCAHVIAAAMGLKHPLETTPQANINLDFPHLAAGEVLCAHIVAWDASADIAGLELRDTLPSNVKPARFVDSADLWGHHFRAFGFPRGYDHGVWASGSILAQTANGWLQLEDTKTTGYTVQPGFSGGPLWDEDLSAVIGMVVAADSPDIRAAYGLPVKLLTAIWPELAEQAIPPCPYRGLFAFREQDAAHFFGRDIFTEQLLEAIYQKSMVAVIGPSGSGKSSVVFAGLLPKLRNPVLLSERSGPSSIPVCWIIASFRPGSYPFDSLALALLPLLEPAMSETDRLIEMRKLSRAIEGNDLSLVDVFTRIIEKNVSGERILFVVDQFEEIYTLCQDDKIRRRFVEVLLALNGRVQGALGSLTLLITLRADFLGIALTHRPFADALQSADLKLGPMNNDELRQAIEQPAKLLKVVFEPGLVERILADVQGQPGDLPLLEFALTLLWEHQSQLRLAHAAYDLIGGVRGSLAQHADSVYQSLSSEQQQQARHVFTQLVRPGLGTEDTRRQATRDELGSDAWNLVRRLADARLVVTERTPQDEQAAEVVHEALIRDWGLLKQWMAADYEFRAWQERLRASLQQWEVTGKDEGAVLRGVALVEAESWMERRQADLSEDEQAYIQLGLALRQREIQAIEERTRRELQQAQQLAKTQRQRALVLLVGLLLSAILGILSFSLYRQSNINLANAQAANTQSVSNAATAQAEGERAYQQAQIALSRQLAAQAQLLNHGKGKLMIQSGLLSVEAARRGAGLQANQALQNYLALAAQQIVQIAHQERITSVAFAPDGKSFVTGSYDGTARIWQTKDGKEIGLVNHNSWVTAVAYSRDGQMVASGSADGIVRVWRVDTGDEMMRATHDDWITAVAFNPDGQLIVSSSADSTARVWQVKDGMEVTRVMHGERVTSLAINSEGTLVVSGSWDGTARLWEIQTGHEIAKISHDGWVTTVAFSQDGQWFASGSLDGTARIWDGKTGKKQTEVIHKNGVSSVAFSPDGLWFVSGSYDGTACVWETKTGQEVVHKQHGGWVTSVAFSPNGQWVLSGSYDGTARVWEAMNGREMVRMSHDDWLSTVSFSPDGRMAISGSYDGTVRVWYPQVDQETTPLAYPQDVTAIAFSFGKQWFASGSADGTACAWQANSIDTKTCITNERDVTSIAINADGSRVVSGGADGSVRVWNTSNGLETMRVYHPNWVTSVAISLDGRWAISGSWDGTARVWDVQTGQEMTRMTHDGWVMSVALSTDAQFAASGGYDGVIHVWQMQNSTNITTINHGNRLTSLAFSPSGKLLVSGSADGKVCVWQVQTAMAIACINHESDIASVVFSPDGEWVVSGSADGSIRVWRSMDGVEEARMDHDLGVIFVGFDDRGRIASVNSGDNKVNFRAWRLEDLIVEACRRLPRNLTDGEWQQYFFDELYQKTCPNLP